MISIIIPAYNEQDNIEQTVNGLVQVLSKSTADYEVIIVDDHSTDDTYSKVEAFKADNVKVIRLSKRGGAHCAIRAGFVHAKGEGAMCLGADGQEDYSVIPQMLKIWREGSDVVWGVRKKREEPLKAKFFNGLFYGLLKLRNRNLKSNIDIVRADFFLVDRSLLNTLNAYQEPNCSLFGLVLSMGVNQSCVEYDRKERRSGESKWTFRARFKLAMNWLFPSGSSEASLEKPLFVIEKSNI